TASGEVLWAGQGALPGRDGWVSLHPAGLASHTLVEPELEFSPDSLEGKILAALNGGGAFFASQLRDLTDAASEADVSDALWALTWSGRISNDTFAPIRSLLAGGTQAH